ncbi:MAG: hypothetical protein K0B14_09140 [Anaerolineaceae bacterium]|nr:hypothetical protein [Anaerolineaceae bacterium]
MVTWDSKIKTESMSWLLEDESPGVRYLALRDLLDMPTEDSELIKARERAHREGPIAKILDAMHPDGYWIEPGPGYLPKYTSTVWSIILLGQLGAKIDMDPRIHLACGYLGE